MRPWRRHITNTKIGLRCGSFRVRMTRTADEADTHAHAAAGADAEGGAELAERVRPRHREIPQRPPPPAARHPSSPRSPLRPARSAAQNEGMISPRPFETPQAHTGRERVTGEENGPVGLFLAAGSASLLVRANRCASRSRTKGPRAYAAASWVHIGRFCSQNKRNDPSDQKEFRIQEMREL